MTLVILPCCVLSLTAVVRDGLVVTSSVLIELLSGAMKGKDIYINFQLSE